MVVYGSEPLAVSGIEGITILYLLPARKFLHRTLGATIAMKHDVERLTILYLKRYIIISMVGDARD